MPFSQNKIRYRHLPHFVGWMAFIFLQLIFLLHLPQARFLEGITPFWVGFIISNGLLIGFFYLEDSILIPKFYAQRHYFSYSLLILLSFLALVGLTLGPTRFLAPPPPQHILMDSPPPVIPALLFRFILLVLAAHLLHKNRAMQRLQKEKASAELQTIKAQIHPHFLFNTLNSIYALSVCKSDSAADAILQLSHIMRYSLKEANQEEVLLEKELSYLRDYVSLQKLRTNASAEVKWEELGDCSGMKIPPMVENAFKYGVSTNHSSFIHIQTEANLPYFSLSIRNSKPPIQPEKGEGLGLAHTQKLLDTRYPHRHEFRQEDSEDTYFIFLKIRLI